jgi:hypothetical protein
VYTYNKCIQDSNLVYSGLPQIEGVKTGLGNAESIFKTIEVSDEKNIVKVISGKGEGGHTESEYDYWFEYYKEGIERLLQLRLNSIGNESTEILKLNYAYDDNIGTVERLSRDIINKIDELSNRFESDQESEINIAIPLNLSYKHWVGMVITKHGNEIKLEYMDSARHPMPQELKEHLNKLLSEHYKNFLISVNEKEVALQSYGNCGLETVENIIEAISPGARVDEENVLVVHNLLLGDSLVFGS